MELCRYIPKFKNNVTDVEIFAWSQNDMAMYVYRETKARYILV